TVLVAELDVAEEAADCLAHAASHRNRHPLQGQDRGLRPHPTPPFFKLASTTSSREIAARAASSSSRRERVTPPGMVASWSLRTSSTAIRIAISRIADSSGALPE